MTCRQIVSSVILLAIALPLRAEPGKPGDKKEKVRHVWPMLVAPNYIPAYKINKGGFLVPVDAEAWESPPSGLAVKKTAGGEVEKLSLNLNYIGPPVEVSSDRFELGRIVSKPGAKGDSAVSKNGGATGDFKPFADAELTGDRCAVCFFPKRRNDWRTVSRIAVALDDVKPSDNRALVFNVATAPIMLRLSTGRPVVVASGTGVFVPWSKDADGMMPVQAVVMRPAKQEVVADTSLNPARFMPVFVFLDADPKALGVTATFLRGVIDPAAAHAPDVSAK